MHGDWFDFLTRYWSIFFLLMLIIFAEWYSGYLRTNYSKTKQQKRAQNPRVDRQWLSKKPEGFICGKYRGKYFRIPEKSDLLHILVLGGSGAGKSTLLAETILQNAHEKVYGKDSPKAANYLIVDIKNELKDLVGNNGCYLINPTNRIASAGWDPYWRLTQQEHPPDDLKVEIFSGIARSLIPSNDKDRYFSENAISMLTGFLADGFSKGEDMVTTIERLLNTNIADELKHFCEDPNMDPVASMFLRRFQGKDSDGFEDICSTMTTGLSCFALQEVKYILRDNQRKIGPSAVREKNVFLSLPDHLLTESQFSPVLRLILEQQMTYLTSTIPERGCRPVGVIIDEFYALGKISCIEHQLSIARGYGVLIIICTQSFSGIEKLYGKEGARIISENCRIKVILESSDPASSGNLVDLCGTYHERMNTHTSGRKGSGSISFQVRNIFEKADFTNLVSQHKTIVITPSGMYRIQKTQWFKERYFIKLHKEQEERL